jgi:hypothetical protein
MLALFLVVSLKVDHGDEDEQLRNQLDDFAARNNRVRRVTDPRATVTILDVQPGKAPSTGGINITITVAETDPSPVFFCRFDAVVVRAFGKIDNEVFCRAPKHSPGQFLLSVSYDRLVWSDDFPFEYAETGKLIRVFVAIFIGISIISCALFAFQKKQCRQGQRKHRKAPAAFAPGYTAGWDRDTGMSKRRPERFL